MHIRHYPENGHFFIAKEGTPVWMVTSRARLSDIVTGLAIGAHPIVKVIPGVVEEVQNFNMTKSGGYRINGPAKTFYWVAPVDRFGRKDHLIHTTWSLHNYHIFKSRYPGHALTLGEDFFLSKREAEEVAAIMKIDYCHERLTKVG